MRRDTDPIEPRTVMIHPHALTQVKKPRNPVPAAVAALALAFVSGAGDFGATGAPPEAVRVEDGASRSDRTSEVPAGTDPKHVEGLGSVPPLRTGLLFGKLDSVRHEMSARSWQTRDALNLAMAGVLVVALACLLWTRRGCRRSAEGLSLDGSAEWQRFDTLAVLESRERGARPPDEGGGS
jgi:hypothetical protein